jgi:hypothetical protein
MDAAVLSALSALGGTALGVVGALGGTWLQQRGEAKRARARMAIDLALADYSVLIDKAKRDGGNVPALAVFLHYHLELVRAMEDGDLSDARLAQIDEARDVLVAGRRQRRGG